ncbi:Outer membrane protein assembly factor BamB, contains PQQ-like beta-propeller repeat [Rhodovulum sp. ES.010]|uniref:PQQ-like beta-propeller repeat protein n=1 Tax=Rhodovulum sp. ES.010 TaxID=1882821 RepID=UPI00092C30A4|nr:PQQ-like beta-propeller repeat protein [Rhodovulum sp. ES.010]SIO28907.1 Outer membrane protein assembly factor BamB, contains PQQ-like beta-propeller repeat [Rhodovulum sp. ES.010]
MKVGLVVGTLAAVTLLAGCGDRELILPGERLGVREALGVGPEAAPAAGSESTARAIRLPPAVVRADYAQPGGSATHLPEHAAFSTHPTRVWSVDIGQGNTRRHRITAMPVVAGGAVFTLDSQSRVTAVSTGGQTLWTADLTLPSERSADASGGGLAVGGGRLFATTGFGTLVALDPATGAELWTQRTDAPVTGAPAYRDGLVYVVSRDNRAWAVKADNGRLQWQLPGTPTPSGLLGAAAPAISDRLAIFPFGSAELVATLRQSGVRVWQASVAGERRGFVYATVSDIIADPVIAGDVVYSGNQSGRAVALDANSGERLWTAEEGAYGALLPVGGAVFMVSDQAELVRLDAETGAVIWTRELPYFKRERSKRWKAVHAHYGPVLAGGRLWVASDDGLLRAFSPESGAETGAVELPGGAATRPAVAGGTLYVVSTPGQLHAFR